VQEEKEFITDKKVPILTFSCNYCHEVVIDGPNITPIIFERKWRKSGGGRRCGHLCNSFAVLQILTTCVHQDIDETYEPKREQIRDSWKIFLEDMGGHVWHTAKGQKGRKIEYERKNMVLNEFQFEKLIMGSSFLVDIDNVATISDAQGTLQRTHFSLPLPSSGIFRSHRFVQGSIDARQIGLSSYVLWQRLFPKVHYTTQLPSVVSDGHGVMLQPCRLKEYDSSVSKLKK